MYDAALAFRAPKSPPVTASGVIGELPLDKLVKVRPSAQRNTLGAQSYALTIHVEAIAFVNETDGGADPPTVAESYTFTLRTGAPGAADTVLATLKVSETGGYGILLDSASIEKQDPAHAVLALDLAVDGTDPSIRFSSSIE